MKNWKRYTKEEEKFLRDNFNKMPLKELAKKLDRTYHGLQWKTQNMKLFKSGRNVFLEQNNLKSNYKLSGFERGFLIGLMEGEGTMSVSKRKVGNYTCYFPEVSICNTDLKILGKADDILKKMGLKTKIRTTTQKEGRPIYRLEVKRMFDIRNLLEDLKEDFVSKKNKERTKLILDYTNLRINKIIKFGHSVPYGNEEKNLFNKNKRLMEMI